MAPPATPVSLPPMTTPPDQLTVIAAEFHDVWQMLAPEYGQAETGARWQAMPRSYQQCLRHVLQTLIERGSISPNWWR